MSDERNGLGWDERLRGADPAVGEEIFARFAERLARLARQHLSQRLAARVDDQDVVQSALRTFFRRSAQGEFRIDSSTHLWRLLARITVLKARQQARFHTAQQRSVAAEAPQPEHAGFALLAHDPGPVEQAALLDQIEALLDGLPPLYGQLLQCRLEGGTVVAIAAELGLSRQSVYRMLDVLEGRFTQLDPEAGREMQP
jgi:DNA-directed RNA polymerase specialized sigma24 family protein